MAEPVSNAEPPTNRLFERQAIAGNGDILPLKTEEKNAIIQHYAPLREQPVAPDINDLLKKQSQAGVAGHPNLTPEEAQQIRDFYASRK